MHVRAHVTPRPFCTHAATLDGQALATRRKLCKTQENSMKSAGQAGGTLGCKPESGASSSVAQLPLG